MLTEDEKQNILKHDERVYYVQKYTGFTKRADQILLAGGVVVFSLLAVFLIATIFRPSYWKYINFVAALVAVLALSTTLLLWFRVSKRVRAAAVDLQHYIGPNEELSSSRSERVLWLVGVVALWVLGAAVVSMKSLLEAPPVTVVLVGSSTATSWLHCTAKLKSDNEREIPLVILPGDTSTGYDMIAGVDDYEKDPNNRVTLVGVSVGCPKNGLKKTNAARESNRAYFVMPLYPDYPLGIVVAGKEMNMFNQEHRLRCNAGGISDCVSVAQIMIFLANKAADNAQRAAEVAKRVAPPDDPRNKKATEAALKATDAAKNALAAADAIKAADDATREQKIKEAGEMVAEANIATKKAVDAAQELTKTAAQAYAAEPKTMHDVLIPNPQSGTRRRFDNLLKLESSASGAFWAGAENPEYFVDWRDIKDGENVVAFGIPVTRTDPAMGKLCTRPSQKPAEIGVCKAGAAGECIATKPGIFAYVSIPENCHKAPRGCTAHPAACRVLRNIYEELRDSPQHTQASWVQNAVTWAENGCEIRGGEHKNGADDFPVEFPSWVTADLPCDD